MQEGCAVTRSAMHKSKMCVGLCAAPHSCKKACVMQGVPACCRGHAGYQQGHGICAAETPGCRSCIPSRGTSPLQPAGHITLSHLQETWPANAQQRNRSSGLSVAQ